MCSYLLRSGRKRVIYITKSKARLKPPIIQLSWQTGFDNELVVVVSGKSVVVLCTDDKH